MQPKGVRPADPIFADPRLARLYDVFDGARTDLDAYVGIIEGYAAQRVLDVGCGTGVLALRLAELGLDVTGVDPALASLEVARAKPGAQRVTWLHGDATSASIGEGYDLAVLTANVVQAIHGHAWPQTLTAVRRALRPDGRLVFESRVPARRAWEEWTPDATRQTADVPGLGVVTTWCEVQTVAEPLITFCWSFRFADDEVLTSTSTLVFRTLDELTVAVTAAGFTVDEVRDAPDRPGAEHVVIARLR